MSEIALFSNDEFRLEITPHETDGFRADATLVARQLGFREAYDLLRTVPADEKGSELSRTPNGGQRSYLTEAGFYRALGQRQADRVKDAEARAFVERFQAWVFGEVLPALRRGELVPAQRAASPAEVAASLTRRDLALMIVAAEDRADAETARANVAEQRAAELEPKAAAADALMEAEGTISVGVLANQYDIGRQKLFDMLRAEFIIQADRRPYQDYAAWFRVVMKSYEDSDGIKHSYVNTRITMTGAVRLYMLLTKRGRTLRKPVFDNQLSLLPGGAA